MKYNPDTYRLLETRSGQQLSGETDTPDGRHDLTGTSVDGIGVELCNERNAMSEVIRRSLDDKPRHVSDFQHSQSHP